MNTAAPPVDLRPDHLGIVRDILRRHIPDRKVLAFGSRATWTAKQYSDLDLAILGDEPLPLGVTAALADDFSESDLPFKVDLVDWARLDESFRDIVRRDQVTVQELLCRSEGPSKADAWPTVNLGELVSNYDSRRIPLSRREREKRQGIYPYYGATGVMDYIDEFLFEGLHLLVAEDGSVEKTDGTPFLQLVDGKFWVNNHAHVLRAESNEETKYLYYALSTIKIRPFISGSVQAKLSQANLNRIPIPYPEESAERSAIVSILGKLDDNIALNRRMNGTLEAMARAIFKDWFVDFGPTCAKMEGRTPYFPFEIWDMFPASFDDQGKPRGWRVGTLDEVAEAPRRNVSPADVAEDTPYIGLEHMPRRSVALTEWEGAGKVVSNKSIFKKGEFLFGKLRPYFHKIGIAPLNGICSTDIVILTPREPSWAAFVLACLSSDAFVDYTDQTSTGTKMPRTSWKTMRQYELCLPSDQVVHAFQDLVQSLLNRMDANIHENRNLAQLRNTLLPKLLGGKIELPRTEAIAEGVVR